jgi:hypothetical protein
MLFLSTFHKHHGQTEVQFDSKGFDVLIYSLNAEDFFYTLIFLKRRRYTVTLHITISAQKCASSTNNANKTCISSLKIIFNESCECLITSFSDRALFFSVTFINKYVALYRDKKIAGLIAVSVKDRHITVQPYFIFGFCFVNFYPIIVKAYATAVF